MTINANIVRDFVGAWSRMDVEELVGYFAADGVYHNIPAKPVSGQANLRKFIGGFLARWDRTDWDILNLVAQGDIVMVERLDRTVVAGKPVNLPCLGIFELRDGKIAAWRDYFDMATFTNALQ